MAEASGRSRAWFAANGTKIRHKVRGALQRDAVADLRAELLLAHRLLADRRFEPAFEAYGSGKGGPDFTVTFRGSARFNVEVTRPRPAPGAEVVAAAIVAKLRQLPPSVPNVLVLAVEEAIPAAAIGSAAIGLRARADAGDPRLLGRVGVEAPRGFYERFLRLGAVVAWAPDRRRVSGSPPGRPSARIAVPPPALSALVARSRRLTDRDRAIARQPA